MIRNGLDEGIFVLKRCLRMIKWLDKEIREADARVAMLIGDCAEDAKQIRSGQARKEEGYNRIARKILCIIHHLLVNGEDYAEEDFTKLPKLNFKALTTS